MNWLSRDDERSGINSLVRIIVGDAALRAKGAQHPLMEALKYFNIITNMYSFDPAMVYMNLFCRLEDKIAKFKKDQIMPDTQHQSQFTVFSLILRELIPQDLEAAACFAKCSRTTAAAYESLVSLIEDQDIVRYRGIKFYLNGGTRAVHPKFVASSDYFNYFDRETGDMLVVSLGKTMIECCPCRNDVGGANIYFELTDRYMMYRDGNFSITLSYEELMNYELSNMSDPLIRDLIATLQEGWEDIQLEMAPVLH